MDPHNKFDELREKVREFPVQSGVYLMKNKSEKIIYVGKAKNLRNRLRSYFTDSKDLSVKTRYLVQNIWTIEFIITRTEVEAFLLEASLIKKHRPKYNIRLRDDKTYPYIRLSANDEFPRLYLSRKVKPDGGIYFGPYTSSAAVFSTIRFLNRVFKIRDCSDAVMKIRNRPCMTYQIGRCTGPCVKLIEVNNYKTSIENALLFLRGQSREVVEKLKQEMLGAAQNEKFEMAAKYRDAIKDIETVLERQAVVTAQAALDQDVMVYYGDSRGCVIEALHIRGGRVIGQRGYFLPDIDITRKEEDPREWFIDFLNQYYDDNFIPDEILLDVDLGLEILKLFEAVLLQRRGRAVHIRFSGQGQADEFALIEMARKNAHVNFEKYLLKSEEKVRGLEEIQAKFGLKLPPKRIECFDISTFHGQESVASQVVFIDGISSRENYRRYKIKTVEGTDDFASMHEVLSRRFREIGNVKPDLILIDGGKGQLNQAIKVLRELQIHDVAVASIAKARTESDFSGVEISRTEERFFLPGQQNPLIFRSSSFGLRILVSLRDEAHRFAISYHRKLRENSSLASALDSIEGLGPVRRTILLKEFSGLEEIRSSSAEKIAERTNLPLSLCEKILKRIGS